jgi:hypothetical protein
MATAGGLPRILKVDLSQRKCHSDGGDNDDPNHKPPISGTDLFFVLRVTCPLQIGHRDALPFAFNQNYIPAHTGSRFGPPLPAALVRRSFAEHATTMFFLHFVGDAGSRWSANPDRIH